MANKPLSRLLPLALGIASLLPAHAQETTDSLPRRELMRYGASLDIWGGTGRLAPSMLMENNGGRFTQGDGIMLDLGAERTLARKNRFEYGFGMEALVGWQREVDYLRYDAENNAFTVNPQSPSALWLQQLWAGVKYRGVYLKAGMWNRDNSLFNSRLGVGDIVLSDNARPVPRLSAGFIDFQNIPFTRGWVQICGEVSWGKMTDSKWNENHFNYYNSFLTTGVWMGFASCHFRTNPSQPFSVTVGMQSATQFGGSAAWYRDGEVYSTYKSPVRFKDFINALFPWAGGSSTNAGDVAYYDGNHLGSWDLRLRYRLRGGDELTAYMQSPWEDGSGVGKLNGFDAVWGVEYRAADRDAILTGAVVEYIDFTNQSGPMHWAPGDKPGTQIPSQATGADDYFNNYMYNGWTNYGQMLGTPFVPGTIYNTDGFLRITDNRVRGFRLGAEGHIDDTLTWRALLGYRTSWGTPLLPKPERTSCTSMLMEATWQPPMLPGVGLRGAIAWDAGKLLGNNFGAMLTISYSGAL
ncbi:MAG: capsule assembly Wzi family protein [Bacteroidales bacterium]|nr:capsule assembly Wzi family protein [Bacteroidales bacterium]